MKHPALTISYYLEAVLAPGKITARVTDTYPECPTFDEIQVGFFHENFPDAGAFFYDFVGPQDFRYDAVSGRPVGTEVDVPPVAQEREVFCRAEFVERREVWCSIGSGDSRWFQHNPWTRRAA